MDKISVRTIIGAIIFSFCLVMATGAEASDAEAPVPGMVTMVDIGAKTCVPCKMMAPILEELKKDYQDKAAILFVDVWESPDAGGQYGIKLIPTQIFYDAKGKEVFRHEGFLDKAAIVDELQKLGVK